MQAKRLARRKRGTVKLSVTVKRHLKRKYDVAALEKINTAVQRWIEADLKRGIRTIHVHLDDSAEMKARGASPVSGKVTAPKIKGAIDVLWKRLKPDYLVLFGGDDILPMFVVSNPHY